MHSHSFHLSAYPEHSMSESQFSTGEHVAAPTSIIGCLQYIAFWCVESRQSRTGKKLYGSLETDCHEKKRQLQMQFTTSQLSLKIP